MNTPGAKWSKTKFVASGRRDEDFPRSTFCELLSPSLVSWSASRVPIILGDSEVTVRKVFAMAVEGGIVAIAARVLKKDGRGI